MNIHKAPGLDSKYLKADDIPDGRKVTVTIERVTVEKVGGDDQRPVVYFAGKQKGLVLNKTNANMIVEICGNDGETENWTGQRISLYSTKVDYAGKRVPAIRVDYPPQPAATQAPPNLGVAAKPGSPLDQATNHRQPASALEEAEEWNVEDPPF